MEFFDVVDEKGEPTGEIVSREEAHQKGIRHHTAHVWILRKRKAGVEVLLQKRSANKDSFPGCYDISSAGHIPAGVDYIPSAIRELKEELGLDVKAEELVYCGLDSIYYEKEFHGERFIDNQVMKVYCLWRDVEPEECKLQEEEVEEVRWMNLAECKKRVAEGSIENCIIPRELELLPSE